MNKTQELSKMFLAWFAARRRVREWIENEAMADVDAEGVNTTADPSQFVTLRRKAYAIEWELLNHPASRETWETALETIQADEPDWALANELRKTRDSIDMLPPNSSDGKRGLKVSGWWFIPVAAWVGKQPKDPSLRPASGDHALPQLNLLREQFHQRLAKSVPDLIETDARLTGENWAFSLQLTPFLNPEALRAGAFLPGDFDAWSAEQRAPFEMPPAPDNPLRAACLGIYLAAPDYQTLATIRDLLRDQMDEDLKAVSGEQVIFGPMMERSAAVDDAELLCWDLWVDEVIDAPLHPKANTRHIVLTVTRDQGYPVRIEGKFLDTDTNTNQVWDSGVMACRLEKDETLLFDSLGPFVSNQRPDVFWSVHSLARDSA